MATLVESPAHDSVGVTCDPHSVQVPFQSSYRTDINSNKDWRSAVVRSLKKTHPTDVKEHQRIVTKALNYSKTRRQSRKTQSTMAPNDNKLTKTGLTVDTTAVEDYNYRSIRKSKSKSNGKKSTQNPTPTTACSTPPTTKSVISTKSSNVGKKGKLRNSSDLRSPGVKATPTNAIVTSRQRGSDYVTTHGANEITPLPDFITQTDKYGNATTPRNAHGSRSSRRSKSPQINGKKEAQDRQDNGDDKNICKGKNTGNNDDQCETLLESIRMMCCCILVEDQRRQGSSNVLNSSAIDQTNRDLSTSHGSSMLLPTDSNDPNKIRLLPKVHPDDVGKKCLVLDLDETLVHSSFRAVPGADFVIPVQIEDVVHFVYVAKRPGADEFLVEMAKHYEIVVYTASLNKYADPLLDLLDPHRVIRTRLFRESCVYYEGNYVKDLSLLDRDITQTIIVDNSPSSYIFHPENAIDCSSFIDDPMDRELDQIGSFLAGVKDVRDVRSVCSWWRQWPEVEFDNNDPSINTFGRL